MANLEVSTNNAIITNWVCGSLAFAILVARFSLNGYTLRRWDATTWITLLSIIVLVARTLCDQLYLDYGTTTSILKNPQAANNAGLAKARIGSILALVSRVLVTTFYWLQCVLLLLLYRRIVGHISWVYRTIQVCWTVLGTTYLIVLLATFLECRPFHLYWQLSAAPGGCVRAYGQLLAQSISNILIDVILMLIFSPVVRTQAQLFTQNLQLALMFVLGSCCIVISCVRVRETFDEHSSQTTRSLWASIQALTAALVANISCIYGAAVLAARRKRDSRRTGASQGCEEHGLTENMTEHSRDGSSRY